MKLYFLFRDYHLDYLYDSERRNNPMYRINLSTARAYKVHLLNQLYFSRIPIERYSFPSKKSWRDYKVKRL